MYARQCPILIRQCLYLIATLTMSCTLRTVILKFVLHYISKYQLSNVKWILVFIILNSVFSLIKQSVYTVCSISFHYHVYQFGTGGCTQKAEPVQGANP